MAAVVPYPPPMAMAFLLPGTYGVTFDLSTSCMKDDPPNGWAIKSTASIYVRIRDALQGIGYTHPQGSVYQHPATTALFNWHAMYNLRAIRPLGVFPSVVSAIEAFHIDLPIMIATPSIQLGGPAVPLALGPTPTGLFPPGLAPVPLPGPFVLPLSVRPNAASVNPANWGL